MINSNFSLHIVLGASYTEELAYQRDHKTVFIVDKIKL